MSSTPEPKHLNNHQRDTLLQIFEHPTNHNVEWLDGLSLLNTIGSVEHRPGNKYLVHIGNETEVLTQHRAAKDIDVQTVVDLRRMLTAAGYDSLADELRAKGKEA
jgi:hypothetical protein